MTETNLKVIILAAGQGTRMKSDLPKVLHTICGVPMLQHVIWAGKNVSEEKPLVVVGYKAETVSKALGEEADYVLQKDQLGTGHAVMTAVPLLQGFTGDVLVLYGDTPLIKGEVLKKLVEEHKKERASATLLSVEVGDPKGFGRIVRNKTGNLHKIVEEKDASEEERKIKEVNTGIYVFNYPDLAETIQKIIPENAQGEYYLTDLIALLAEKGKKVQAVVSEGDTDFLGPNDRRSLAETEQAMRRRILEYWMAEGVTIVDPSSTYIDIKVSIGRDSIIYPGTFLQGETKIGEKCQIGPYSQIINSTIHGQTVIRFSLLDQVEAGKRVTIGPYSYLRPGTILANDTKVGGFVETKNARVGEGSKVPHLSYIGDCRIGEMVNIGAGTITCNYDGHAKHQTTIGDGAFVGSNTNLVAPVNVGKGALIGAGSTITKDIPDHALALARSKQITKEGWVKRKNN